MLGVHHALRPLPAVRRGRDDLCDNFFAMNRLKGTLYDGTTRLRRTDGSPLAMYSMAGLAEYAVVPATDVFPLPPGLPLAESAVLGCAVFTAYGAVRHGADLRGGERVAVVAAGGVGLNIIQIARAFGASQIIAVDVRDDKLEIARRVGATDVVNASDGRTPPSAFARSRTAAASTWRSKALGRPETFIQALEIIGDGGRMVAVGIAAGQDDGAGRNHAAGPPRPADHRLVRRPHPRGHAGDRPARRARHVPAGGDRHAAVSARGGRRRLSGARPRRNRRPGDRRTMTR